MPTRHSRLWRWGLIIGALAAMVLLAAGLSVPASTSTWTGAAPWSYSQNGSPTSQQPWIGRILIVAGLVLMLTLAVANVLLAARRQRPLPKVNFSALSVVLMLIIVAVLRPEVLERLQGPPPPAMPGSGAATPGAAAPPLPAALPVALVYLLNLAAAALLVGLAWAVWRKAHRPKPQAQALVALKAAQAARMALADWQSGFPLADVIIRCYREMSDLVAEKRALQRPADMTPREFVDRLAQAGVPAQPAEQLTSLFELARYSTRPLGAAEEAAARDCLKALAAALEAPA